MRTSTRRFVRVIAFAAGGLLAVSACSGGGGKTLTKAQFIAQADAICTKYQQQLETEGTKLGDNPDPKKAVATLLPIARQEINAIKTRRRSRRSSTR
jgi:hypothetical protein